MNNILEKVISILAGNLNSDLSYLIHDICTLYILSFFVRDEVSECQHLSKCPRTE